jgi:hypothetical protein
MLLLRRSSPIRLLAFLLGAAFGLEAGVARADDSPVTIRELDPSTGAAIKPEAKALTYLSLGPLLSFVDASNIRSTAGLGTTSTLGYAIGIEASMNHYAGQKVFAFGYGAFIQTQLEDEKSFRTDIGLQGNAGPAGLELGLGIRQGSSETCVTTTCATTGSLHTAVFVSVGYVVLTFRLSPEIFTFPTYAGESGFGLETGFTVALKLPIALQGRDPTGFAVQANGHAW